MALVCAMICIPVALDIKTSKLDDSWPVLVQVNLHQETNLWTHFM